MRQDGPGRLLAQRRPDRALAEAVSAAGGTLDEVDLIVRTDLPAEQVRAAFAQVSAASTPVSAPDWVVITSPHTVGVLQRAGIDLTNLLTSGTRLATVGAATTTACTAAGWPVALAPEPPGSGGAALAQIFPASPGNVLVPGAATSAGTLEPGLAQLGWDVVPVPVYRTTAAAAVNPAVKARWQRGEYQALIGTSPSVVRAAAELLGPAGLNSTAGLTNPAGLTSTVGRCVAIGATTYAAALEAGFDVVQAESPAPEAVLRAADALTPR